jgi:hypothetical protein
MRPEEGQRWRRRRRRGRGATWRPRWAQLYFDPTPPAPPPCIPRILAQPPADVLFVSWTSVGLYSIILLAGQSFNTQPGARSPSASGHRHPSPPNQPTTADPAARQHPTFGRPPPHGFGTASLAESPGSAFSWTQIPLPFPSSVSHTRFHPWEHVMLTRPKLFFRGWLRTNPLPWHPRLRIERSARPHPWAHLS